MSVAADTLIAWLTVSVAIEKAMAPQPTIGELYGAIGAMLRNRHRVKPAALQTWDDAVTLLKAEAAWRIRQRPHQQNLAL